MEILCESYKLDAGSKGEIPRDFSESVFDSIEDVIDGIQMKITLEAILKKQFKKCASNPTVENLRRVYKEKNREIVPQKMFDLLKFGRSDAA